MCYVADVVEPRFNLVTIYEKAVCDSRNVSHHPHRKGIVRA